MGFLVQCETSHTSPLTLKIAVNFNKWWTVTFTNTKTCYLLSTKFERFSLSDELQTNHCDYWRSWNYSIYERVVDLYAEAKTFLYAMFVLEAIVPRACTSTPRGLELEIWEQNYCLSTSGWTAHALLMANEMPSSNASSQRSSFSRSAGQG